VCADGDEEGVDGPDAGGDGQSGGDGGLFGGAFGQRCGGDDGHDADDGSDAEVQSAGGDDHDHGGADEGDGQGDGDGGFDEALQFTRDESEPDGGVGHDAGPDGQHEEDPEAAGEQSPAGIFVKNAGRLGRGIQQGRSPRQGVIVEIDHGWVSLRKKHRPCLQTLGASEADTAEHSRRRRRFQGLSAKNIRAVFWGAQIGE